MAHHYNNSLYDRLVDRLNRFPQGAPPSESLYKILQILFSEKEAGLVAQLPIIPFTAETAAKVWQVNLAEARNTLENLASRAMLLDMEQHDEQYYCLPPPMAGFFEFSMMRMRNDIDQHALAELFHQYLNVEEDFVRALFAEGSTPIGRIFPQEYALDLSPKLEVLDYEKASNVIETAADIGVSMCYCRHKQSHLGLACDAPVDICMSFNTTAYSLIKHGHARKVDVVEGLELLAQAQEHNLVQFGENVREHVNYICNCCACCCEALQAIQKFAIARTIHSNFLADINAASCVSCGKCIKVCPVQAIEYNPVTKKAQVIHEKCIGCGVCVRNCATRAIILIARPDRQITPQNTTNRIVIMAAERGLIKELIADNNALMSYKILASIMSTLLKAPKPIRDFAIKQLKSRYMEALVAKLVD